MKNKKRFSLVCASIIIVVLVISMLLPTAFAEDLWNKDLTGTNVSWNSINTNAKKILLGETAWEWASIALGVHPENNITVLAGKIFKFDSFTDTVKIDGVDQKISLLTSGAAAYDVMSVIGLALIFLYFLIEILDEVQADNFNTEHLVKKLITLAIAILVILNGATLFTKIGELGDALIDDTTDAMFAAASDAGRKEILDISNKFAEAAGDDGWLSSITAIGTSAGIVMSYAIPYLLMLAALAVAYLTSFARFLEILVRFVFAPLGCAPLVSGGSKSSGMRYIKKFASCVVTGAVCVAAVGSAQILMGLSSGVSGMIAKVIVPLTLIGFMMKAGRIADDIVGV